LAVDEQQQQGPVGVHTHQQGLLGRQLLLESQEIERQAQVHLDRDEQES
jgi:hypothetical protein